MVENGLRLKYVIGVDSFIITDVLTGRVIAYSKGNWESTSLDPQLVSDEISTLVECFTTAADDVKWFSKKVPKGNGELRIEHIGHFRWEMTMDGGTCTLDTKVATRSRRFDDTAAIARLQFVIATLVQTQGSIRRPEVEVVRRISDAKMLLWVYDGHTVVHTEEAVQGLMMVNCLVDGIAYDFLQVSPCAETGTCGLIDLNGKVICEFPLDKSITAYYKSVEEVFSKED